MTWQQAILELAQLERPSASDGERRAAGRIAVWLRECGCSVRVERERAHGGYWSPVGLANSLALGAGLLSLPRESGSRRAVGAVLAALAAAALWDDLGHGRRWFRRSVLPRRDTWNVVAGAGDPGADRVVAFVAHHDAAHSGLVFHPALGRIGPTVLPRLHARASHTLPILHGVWLGPAMVSIGAALSGRQLLQAGIAMSAGAVAAMADIGRHPVVPGANDNLRAVGVLLALAAALRERPVDVVRVLLISTGSGMRDYPMAMREALAHAAAAAGVSIGRGVRTVAATDAIIALRADYPIVTLASVEDTKLPLNYHWPSDTADALHWETIEQAIATCESFIRSRDGRTRTFSQPPADRPRHAARRGPGS